MPDLPLFSVQEFPALHSPLLALNDVSCERGNRRLFCQLSVQLMAGQALQINGGNGAGKTSLLRIAAGLLAPAAGAVCYLGEPLADNSYNHRSQLLFLGHQAAVKGSLTALENLRYPVDGRHRFSTEAIFQALAAVGLAGFEDLPCRTFSAGQRRRVALALLILSDARLWLLDEPFTAIDRTGVELIERLMAAHLQRGGAIMLTSHQPVALPGLLALELSGGDSHG